MIDDPYFYCSQYLEIQKELNRLKEMHTQCSGIVDHFRETARLQSELNLAKQIVEVSPPLTSLLETNKMW